MQSDNDHFCLDFGLRFSVCRLAIDLSLIIVSISVKYVSMCLLTILFPFKLRFSCVVKQMNLVAGHRCIVTDQAASAAFVVEVPSRQAVIPSRQAVIPSRQAAARMASVAVRMASVAARMALVAARMALVAARMALVVVRMALVVIAWVVAKGKLAVERESAEGPSSMTIP